MNSLSTISKPKRQLLLSVVIFKGIRVLPFQEDLLFVFKQGNASFFIGNPPGRIPIWGVCVGPAKLLPFDIGQIPFDVAVLKIK